MKCVVEPKYFEDKEYGLNDDPHRNPILHSKIEDTMGLAGGVEVEENKRVIVVEVYELLEQEGGGDLRF